MRVPDVAPDLHAIRASKTLPPVKTRRRPL